MMHDPSELPREMRKGHPDWALEEARIVERELRTAKLIRWTLITCAFAFALAIIAAWRWG